MDLYTVRAEDYDEMREDIIQLLVYKEMSRIEPELWQAIERYEPGHKNYFHSLAQMVWDELRQMIARQPDITLMNEYEKLP